VIDAFIPFLAHGRTFYLGLGTVASDLVIVLIVTGIARGRFANRWPWTWRAIHLTAYLCWPLAIVHGLLAGRTPKPYVDWSYGACLALVGLALIIRLVATLRSRNETSPHPLSDRAGALPAPPTQWLPAPPAIAPDRRYDARSAVPGGLSHAPRALPPGPSAGRPASPQPPYPRLSARRYSPSHPDQRGHSSGPWQYEPEPDASAYPSYPGTAGL
jgi:hypothetical protein